MSAWLDMSQALKARLESLQKMSRIAVIVDRQKEIDVIIAEKIAKLTGCLTILFDRAPVVDNLAQLVTGCAFTLRLYTLPVLRGEEDIPADDILEAILPAISGWHPDGEDARYDEKFVITSDPELMPDRKYHVYEFTAACRVTLPTPQFNV